MPVVLAATLALTAVIGYTAKTARPRANVIAPPQRSATSLAELSTQARSARALLDGEKMASLVGELEHIAATTTMKTKSVAAKVELVELHAAIALEAAIRAEVDPVGREAAQKVAATAIGKARDLGLELGDDTADPARVDAALARAELAAGTDLTDTFPVVLLPTFRDAELRAAAISIPIWRGPTPDEALAKSIAAQLAATDNQSALVRLLTARALAATGADDAAGRKIDDVLADAPRQALALAMQRSLRAPAIAVAMPPDEDPTVIDDPTPTKPEPIATPEPAKPEPVTPEPAKPEPAKPEPAKPEPAKPEPAKPEPATPEPAKPEPAKPKPAKPEGESKKKYDTLLAEGCKLVRGGDAAAGFEVLKEAFDLNPNAVAVTVCMAEAHLALGREASARALCDRALRKSPSDRRALLLAAELELARGNESAALQHYKKILENHPDDSKAKAYVESHGG
jgi:tetratricopeptide (TPR) repeat protein